MIKIHNKIISKKHKEAKTIVSKMLGLMFKFKVDQPLVFFFKKEKIVPLHMIFVFTPIDLIFINERMKVIELKENFLPFTFYTNKKKAKYLIECKRGTIKKNKIKLGDIVYISSNKL